MKNKTPIQELFKMMNEHYAFGVSNAEDWLEKEKQFAFDCFEAGQFMSGCDAIAAFEQFYCKYAEQHTK
ncbi:MAG: hypothetical protein ACYC5G_05240 [Candidatus Doudnabacteria bacterium]